MKQTLRLSPKVEVRSAAADALTGRADPDLDQLRELQEAYSSVLDETVWPESDQGEFLEYVTQTVQEFITAIQAQAEAGRLTVVMALLRPLQERSEYALAAAIAPEFSRNCLSRMAHETETGPKGRSGPLVQEVRGIINRLETSRGEDEAVSSSAGTEDLLQLGRNLYGIGSGFQHLSIGLSRLAADNDELLRGLVGMACGRVQIALRQVLKATQIAGVDDTAAWHAANRLVMRLAGS